MAKAPALPLVAICGRPNVGKSTLFNRIVGKQRAIVHSEEGITRDRTYGTAEWLGKKFRLVDTGGVVENPLDPVSHKVQEQVRAALEEADAIIFVVDGQQEITRTDEELRDELFKYGKPVFVAVNKLDNERLQINLADFYVLGLGEPLPVSAGHGLGIEDLVRAVIGVLPENARAAAEEHEPGTKVAVIGKPNVGKSSLVNAILNRERTIVDEKPGTTRDAIDIDFVWNDRAYVLIDTAGMRRKAGIKEAVEHFSVSRSLRAIRRADVCLVLIDATEGVTEQDKRILSYVRENGAGMVLVWTKWDLIEDKDRRFKELAEEMNLKAPFLNYVPSITISNITRQRLFKIFDLVDMVRAESEKRITTPDLNRFFEELRGQEAAGSQKGKRAKVLYGTQTGVKPAAFLLFVNQKRLFHFSYLRFIENRLRERFGFQGVPLRLELREETRERR
ncbi:MAG TPA: ribosome biogenesis GTPase Der [Candidatus Hydrogenedentes bacterium]|nr:ribosome biogenesis GTPase Der [Candidatus Hydrogenedentota bacterium]HQM47613.1 ribosome biogenesis GTPase Der [Candidatus Hydrogenedentota bacterium]